MKHLLIVLLLFAPVISEAKVKAVKVPIELREPVSADFAAQQFSGLDELDKEGKHDKCTDFNFSVYLDKGPTVNLPPCLLFQVDKSGHTNSDAGVMLSMGGHLFFLPLLGQQDDTYLYEASDKSLSIRMRIYKTEGGGDGADYFGNLDVTFQKKTKHYPIKYYRGG